MHRRCAVGLMCLVFALSAGASQGFAQGAGSTADTWVLRTRVVMTGVSDSSEPEGYKVYSGIGLEIDVTRALGRRLAIGFTSGTHSREIELERGAAGKVNLGSVEVLPIDLLLQVQLRPGARFRPYVAAGVGFSVFWEKSGALDSTDLTPGVGPALSVGFDYDLSPRVVFSTEFRARRLTTDLESAGAATATLSLHPSSLSAGFGFRF